MYSERIDGPTPNGGEYAIITSLDKPDNDTGTQIAKCVIREYDSNGNLIAETFAI